MAAIIKACKHQFLGNQYEIPWLELCQLQLQYRKEESLDKESILAKIAEPQKYFYTFSRERLAALRDAKIKGTGWLS